MAKKFLNLQCGRDEGTLGNMKIQIQRINVNGNVKSRYKAQEDFVVTCGLSYFQSYIMYHFNMATITDSPKHNSITEGLSNWTNVNKMKVFNTVMEEILTDLYIPFDVQGMNFLQRFFIIVQMKDAIREGDVKRISIVLKNMIPFFYSHSRLSKYLTECIDYILKTEHTLSPYMSPKVQAGSFVNQKGRPGKNKAADIQKENEVKLLNKTKLRNR
ncbi:hypothetical protein MAR_019218 [Mya arenaria]|uniref:DUF6589 domain-containing protein n=1 Tax=Mya arenaria TaxID=6604 RepID=A0ABY7EGZ3_MYAAR|nr:hypothetical protein MAR_019218 [Mya arenaria]